MSIGAGHARETQAKSENRVVCAVARVLRRYRDKNVFYHPGDALKGEWKRSRNADNTGFIPGSRIVRMSDIEWRFECDAVNRLAAFWDGNLRMNTRLQFIRLLGAIALDPKTRKAYAYAEQDTFDPGEGEYVPSREPVYSMDILEAEKRFQTLFGCQPSIPSPLHAWTQRSDEFKAREGECVILTDLHRITGKLWHFCTVCRADQLMGELLMQPDYGLGDLELLESNRALFDDYWRRLGPAVRCPSALCVGARS